MRTRAEEERVKRGRAEARFERLYAEHGRDVLAYAVRRSPAAQDGADVLAETFLVAWRRLDDVPPGEAARLWLYGVARRVLANQQRSERRRERLAERMRRELPAALGDLPARGLETGAVRVALARLAAEDQEVLRLSAWEELTPREIAAVLGIGHVAARSRLHRARHRLRDALDRESELEHESESEETNAFRLQEAS